MAPSEDSENLSSSDNEGSGSDDDGDGEVVDVPPAVVVDVLEPLASSSIDVPTPAVVVDALEPSAVSSIDVPPPAVAVEKVLGLPKRAKARKRLDAGVDFLRERVGQCLPALGGMVLSLEAFGEALNQMSTEVD